MKTEVVSVFVLIILKASSGGSLAVNLITPNFSVVLRVAMVCSENCSWRLTRARVALLAPAGWLA